MLSGTLKSQVALVSSFKKAFHVVTVPGFNIFICIE